MKVINMPFAEAINISEDALMNYSVLLDAFDTGVCLFDKRGEIKYANHAYCELFRTTNERAKELNLYKGFKDELSLKCLKFQKKFEGKINYHIGEKLLYSKAFPIFKEGIFLGVLTTYEEFNEENNFTSSVKSDLINPFKEYIIGNNQKLLKELCLANKAAKSNSTIMIRGESGTGKELVAKAIHHSSSRASKPFVAINCGAIPATLIESELFGHVQGAFTGASYNKIGKFEQANGGTLFLDEIGDLPLELQAKLLRVLQEREIEKIGSCKTVPIDVRIITATHCNLERMIEEGKFREDLFYRLNVIPITMPALRERRDDIHSLVISFIKLFSERDQIEISNDALSAIEKYSWPGNIRELKNTIERLVVLSSNGLITLGDLPSHISEIFELSYADECIVNTKGGDLLPYESYDKEIIRLALNQYKSFNLAGKALGLTHKTVAAKARKYGLVN